MMAYYVVFRFSCGRSCDCCHSSGRSSLFVGAHGGQVYALESLADQDELQFEVCVCVCVWVCVCVCVWVQWWPSGLHSELSTLGF